MVHSQQIASSQLQAYQLSLDPKKFAEVIEFGADLVQADAEDKPTLREMVKGRRFTGHFPGATPLARRDQRAGKPGRAVHRASCS